MVRGGGVHTVKERAPWHAQCYSEALPGVGLGYDRLESPGGKCTVLAQQCCDQPNSFHCIDLGVRCTQSRANDESQPVRVMLGMTLFAPMTAVRVARSAIANHKVKS